MAQKKNPAAVALGRKGGKGRAATKGWERIPTEQRKKMASKAAKARWAKAKKKSV
jgi:hypothetical protein